MAQTETQSLTPANLPAVVAEVVAKQPITDIHTHLYAPAFGDLLLWGVDELLTYHYLVAEVFRKTDLDYETFWSLTKSEQADLIWRTLFLEHSPVSEACRGVVTVFNALGFDLGKRDLNVYRKALAAMKVEDFVDRVFALAGLREVVMTNDPFDPKERPVWMGAGPGDGRFRAALRIDVLLNQYHAQGCAALQADGYGVDDALSPKAVAEVRRFLEDWIDRMDPLYMAVSLPPDFAFPEDSARGRLIAEAVLPISRKRNVPFALMIGVTRAVQPGLRLAGDGVGRADLSSLEYLLREHGDNRFMATLLSRENQHELCVLGRKFRNLMIFGCWWFLNVPSIIDEMTRQRFELLGLSHIPQHSDARVLDQVIYKWGHSRKIIAGVLAEKYADLVDAGWVLTKAEIERDVANLFGGNFHRFLNR